MPLQDIKEITIYEVQTLQSKFLDALKESSDIEFDMKTLGKIDLVGVQLLVSFVKTASDEHKKINFKNIPANIRQQIEQLNATKALGLQV